MIISLETAQVLRRQLLHYLEVADQIPHEGLAMGEWHSECGTAHCMAGWMAVIEGRQEAFKYAGRGAGSIVFQEFMAPIHPHSTFLGVVDSVVSAKSMPSFRTAPFDQRFATCIAAALFGPSQPNDLELLARRARLLLFRTERLIEWYEDHAPGTRRAARADHSRIEEPA